ncbi:MAG: GNAT family N-acetyltransferase, partial [Polyangiaceae bacterium]
MILRPVKLQLRGGKTTKCGAACRNARSLHCDCECGGKNHGAKGHYVHATSARPKLAVRGARGDYGPHNAVFNAIGPYTVEGNVLEDRDHAIGQLTFGVYDNYLELSIIRIDPAFRGQGHARGVIAQLVKIADARSLTMLLSPTNQWGASLARLKALYKSFGFVENKGRRKDFAINASMYRLPHPAHGNARPGIPPEIAKALPEIVRVAQKQYDDWTVDEEGYDEEVGGGGICHLIADEIVEVLDKHDVMATTVSSSHEVHVYVVARVPTGVWQIDIRPHVYERGGGYSWTKIPGVTFDASDVEVDRLSSNPRDFKEYVEDWQSDDEPDDEDTAGHGDAGAVEAGWRASLSNPDDVDR